jgi:hypothetical protein
MSLGFLDGRRDRKGKLGTTTTTTTTTARGWLRETVEGDKGDEKPCGKMCYGILVWAARCVFVA